MYRGAGDHSQVYVEQRYSDGISDATISSIIRTFDDEVYDLVRTTFAPESDVDGNGRVILFLLDIKDGYSGSGGYVAGYFDATHLSDATVVPNSNGADMLFMDINPGIPGDDTFDITMAHEMQHLVNFYYRAIRGTHNFQETWVNEGLSLATEYLFQGSQVEGRVNGYRYDPGIASGESFYFWENRLEDYASGYMFFQWLRVQSGGTAIYTDVFEGTEGNFQTVLDEAAAHIDPSYNNWALLLADWMTANTLNRPTGPFGYEGEIDIDGDGDIDSDDRVQPLDLRLSSTQSLVQGEAIVRASGTAFSEPTGDGPSIRYRGINTVGAPVDDPTSGVFDYLLAYNPTTDLSSSVAEDARLPAVVATASGNGARSPGADAPPQSGTYPIGVILGPHGPDRSGLLAPARE